MFLVDGQDLPTAEFGGGRVSIPEEMHPLMHGDAKRARLETVAYIAA